MKSIRLLQTLYSKLSNVEHLQFHCKATAFISDIIDALPNLPGIYEIYASMYHQEYLAYKHIHSITELKTIVSLNKEREEQTSEEKNLQKMNGIRLHTDWAYTELVKMINTTYNNYDISEDKKDEQIILSILIDHLNALTNETERTYAYRSYHKTSMVHDNNILRNKPYQMTIYEQSLVNGNNQMCIKTADMKGFAKALYNEALSAVMNTGTEVFPNPFTVVGFCNNNDNLPNGLLFVPTSEMSFMDKLQGNLVEPVPLIKDGRVLARIFGLINPEMLP